MSGTRAAPGAGAGRTRLELLTPAASPEEAAAIVAALEQFMRATAPRAQAAGERDRWRETALLEGVERDPRELAGHPWINT